MPISESRRGMNTEELKQFTVLQHAQLQTQTELRDFKMEARANIQKLNRIVFEGDGDKEIPLTERVRNEETFTKSVRFWLKTVAVAIVIQTVTFGTAAIVYFIRLYPLLEKLSTNP